MQGTFQCNVCCCSRLSLPSAPPSLLSIPDPLCPAPLPSPHATRPPPFTPAGACAWAAGGAAAVGAAAVRGAVRPGSHTPSPGKTAGGAAPDLRRDCPLTQHRPAAGCVRACVCNGKGVVAKASRLALAELGARFESANTTTRRARTHMHRGTWFSFPSTPSAHTHTHTHSLTHTHTRPQAWCSAV